MLVGINLLREGLDLPEVSLVAILDADKEGFLRSETSLIQTIGRAARNVDGQVIMYADTVTDSMQRAISETQPAPRSCSRPTTRSTASTRRRSARPSPTSSPTLRPDRDGAGARSATSARARRDSDARVELGRAARTTSSSRLIHTLEEEMHEASADLRFEYAARLRDEIKDLKRELREVG